MEEKCHFCRYAVCRLPEIPNIYLIDFTLDVTWLKELSYTVNLPRLCFTLLNPLTHVKTPSSLETE